MIFSRKKILPTIISALIFGILSILPFSVFALTVPEFPFKEGTLVQARGSSVRYLIVKNEKRRILNSFTLHELGFTRRDVVQADPAVLKLILTGELIKIQPPKINGMFDMHEHFRAGGNMDLYLEVAQKLGVGKTVFVPTGNSPDNGGYKEHTAALLAEYEKHPDRIIPFCTIDEADSQAPEIFTQCLDEGGKGLKILDGHPDFYDTPLDNDVMKQVFKIANDRDVPVLVHVSIITLPKAKQEFKDLMDAFPNTRVQFAHYCSTIYWGINLDQCAEFLDAYPNMMIDLSMGGGIERYFKFMTQPMSILSGQGEPTPSIELIKDFLLKYQNRIMYGTDSIIAASGPTTKRDWLRGRMMCDFSLLQEKWYRCPVVNKGQYTLLPGFNFPEEILRKIFVDNPKRFLKL